MQPRHSGNRRVDRVAAEKDSWISQIRKGVVEVAILGMVSRREMYGSEIVSELSDRPGLAISAGTIYPLLARLKKAGLIDSVWRESPVGPPRKYYTLTALGQGELAEMASAWDGVSADITAVLKGIDRD